MVDVPVGEPVHRWSREFESAWGPPEKSRFKLVTAPKKGRRSLEIKSSSDFFFGRLTAGPKKGRWSSRNSRIQVRIQEFILIPVWCFPGKVDLGSTFVGESWRQRWRNFQCSTVLSRGTAFVLLLGASPWPPMSFSHTVLSGTLALRTVLSAAVKFEPHESSRWSAAASCPCLF